MDMKPQKPLLWERIRSEMRWEYTGIWPSIRTYTIDGDDRHHCNDCDALLMRKRQYCDECKRKRKAQRAQRRIKGRHRAL
jgi:hypothetical protein